MAMKEYIGKRIAAIDFGKKRVGIAICDELHITVTPKKCLYYDNYSFWYEINEYIENYHIAAFVVGMPYNLKNEKTEVISSIKTFIQELKERTRLEVFEFDESFSTIRAVQTMIESGKKKKFRSKKENKDMFAAAIILKDFLNEMN